MLLPANALATSASGVRRETVELLHPNLNAGVQPQVASAANLFGLVDGSKVKESNRGCGRVQDACPLRWSPQVHGACRDAIGYARSVVAIELNAATDNPLVFADRDEVLSNGNFHGE